MNDIIMPTKKLINDTIGSAFIRTSWIISQNSLHRIFALSLKNEFFWLEKKNKKEEEQNNLNQKHIENLKKLKMMQKKQKRKK